MSYYRVCPHCGAALDPGERCDCVKEEYSGKKEVEGQFGIFVPDKIPGTV